MKIDPALCTIAHGFSHGKTEGQAPLQSIVIDSPLPRAEALGNYARSGAHRHSRESGNPWVMKMDPRFRADDGMDPRLRGDDGPQNPADIIRRLLIDVCKPLTTIMRVDMKKLMKYALYATIGTVGIVILILIGGYFYDMSLTPEERAQAAAARAQRDSVAGVERARQDSIKRAKELATHDTEAYIVSKDFVKSRLKYPEESDFPITPDASIHLGNGVYEVRGTVKAKNAFGVTSKYTWLTRLRFKGGSDLETTSWDLMDLRMAE